MRAGPLVVGGMVAALVLAGVDPPARATPADEAEPLVKEGITLRGAFRDVEALERFQRAYEIAKTARIMAQIGVAEQALGRWVDAEIHITRALGAAGDAWIVKNRPTLESALTAIRSHLGSLEILGKPPGAEIRIEGEVVGRLPLATPLRLPVGRTTLDVGAPGHFVVTRTVAIEPGKLTRETVVLRANEVARGAPATSAEGSAAGATRAKPEPAVTVVAPAASAGQEAAGQGEGGIAPHRSAEDADGASVGGGWRRPTEITVAGLAVVGLAFGIVEHLKWSDKADSFGSMNACGVSLSDRGGATCQQLYSDGQSARTLTFVGYGAAAALGVTAAVLFFTDRGGTTSQKVACAPQVQSRGVACGLRF